MSSRSTYYNEHDPKAAAWLRELMKVGLIPEGYVDERSILDVRAADLAGYGSCHFFAGIGGWPYALRLAGWSDDRPVWTGSCPCQPFSAAGKQLGTADERHLWPVWFNLIRDYREHVGEIPVVFGEQVASAAGRDWYAGVRADLETLGHAVGCADLCAACCGEEGEGWFLLDGTEEVEVRPTTLGAPHIRQRLFWMAYAAGSRHIGAQQYSESQARNEARMQLPGSDSALGGLAHADEGQRGRIADGEGRLGDGASARWEQGDGQLECGSSPNGLGDSEKFAERPGLRESESDYDFRSETGRGRFGDTGAVGGMEHPIESRLEGHTGHGDDGNEPGRLGAIPPRSTPEASGLGHWADFDLLPCLDGKARRVEPGTFPLVAGLPGRVGLLRGYGNAIVPELAAQFIQACEEAREERVA